MPARKTTQVALTITKTTTLVATSEQMGDYIENPLNAENDNYGDLQYYGQGFSPFFMSLGLWLGALFIFFILEPLYPRRNPKSTSRWHTVLGRMPMYAGCCLLESVAIVTVMNAIGVMTDSTLPVIWLYVYAFGVSFAFMLMMQFMNLTLGVIGKGAAVILTVFQVACAGGTLPLELGQSFVGAIYPFLPFTYTVDGFREIISTGNLAIAGIDYLKVFGMALCCLILSLACFKFALWRQRNDDSDYVAWHFVPLNKSRLSHSNFVAESTGEETVPAIGESKAEPVGV